MRHIWEEKEAVIFDLDGTVVDSMWVWPKVDIEFLGQRGMELPEDLQTALDGKSFYESAVYMKRRFRLEESEEELMDIWNHMAMDMYVHKVKTKEYVETFLKDLKQKGIKTGIASSNSHVLVEATLRSNGILEYFDSVHTANEVAQGKPFPDIYLLVANDLQVKPENCLIFEDIVMGILAGKNAGMETCAIYDSYSAYDDERKRETADYYIHSYKELL